MLYLAPQKDLCLLPYKWGGVYFLFSPLPLICLQQLKAFLSGLHADGLTASRKLFFCFQPFLLGVSDCWQKTEAPRILPCLKLGPSEVRVGNCSHHTLYLESSFFFKKSPDKHPACLLIAFSSLHKCKFSRKTSTDSKVYQAVQEQSPPHPPLPQQLPNQLLNTGFSLLASLTYLRDVKAIVFALSFEKKIHSVSGCHDWVLLGSPSFIVHSKYISLMDLTCGRINSFFLLWCHQITATLQIKQNLLSHWLPEFIVSWNHLLSQAHRLHFASFFFLQQIMTINPVAKSACCLPVEEGWVFLPLAGFHGASPQL